MTRRRAGRPAIHREPDNRPAPLLRPLLVASALLLGALPPQVLAQPAAAAQTVPAGPLGAALATFAGSVGVTLSIDPALVAGRSSAGISGEHPPARGFALLLLDTGLEAVEERPGTYVLRRRRGSDGATLMRPVKVTAAADAFATEGSASYTAAAVTLGKTPLSLRETPQSVSVLTRQRLDDQNFVELTEAMKYVPGVTVRRQSSTGNRSDIYARGYQASTYQLDGLNTHNNPATMETFDLALFDRVEALRGPAGLFSGAGEPGVTINLVRKRARAPFQLQAALGAGSWDRYRAEADVTGALVESGRLRGRFVAVGEEFGSYLDGVDGDKQVAYGTLEFDLSPNTTLSAGGTWQRSTSFYDTGLPAYADGRLPKVPRSTAVIADWSTADPKSVDGFLELESRRADGGLFKIALRRQDRTQRDVYINAYSAIANDGTSRFNQAQSVGRDYEDTTADIFLSTPFSWGGRTHNVVVGADYRNSDQLTVLDVGAMNSTVNLYDYYPQSVPQPTFVPNWNNLAKIDSYGAYGQLRFKLLDALTLVGGARVSWWESTSHNRTAALKSGYESNGEVTPYAALIFDLSDALSLYASYAEIFQPQNSVAFGGGTIEPRVGGQYEAGIKGEFFDGRLNTSAAVFRIDDENRALADPAPGRTGFFVAAGKVRSEGFETEISGELTPRWNISAGYAYTKTEYLRGTALQTGQSFSTFTPRHNFNLWTHYRLPDNLVRGLEVGAGVRAVSDFYTETAVARWVGAGYAVTSLLVGYQVNEHYKVSLNIDNLFDRQYWERVENSLRSNYYGAPRSATVTVRATF